MTPQGLIAHTWMDRIIRFCLTRSVLIVLLVVLGAVWGLRAAPFDWNLGGFPRSAVPADAIPDIGENQQIVFTEWMGRSPQDVQDQITYPLTATLMGVPGVKTVRSTSMFGFSSIYVIFKEDVDFYWSRSRLLEKLNSLPADTLPAGVKPSLGPDATGLGQVFWYTLEGRDKDGRPSGGWDLHELRTIQDWYVRYALLSVEGVSEVGSVGGFVREYQIDADPDLMRANGVGLMDLVQAVRDSNLDVGANTIEINQVEYLIRGVGFVKNANDLRQSVVRVNNGIPVLIENVAQVNFGPATRRGALDKGGAEAVGGVVVARYGENPLAVIKNVKAKIEEITPGLAKKTLADGSVSQVRIVPFYDRSGLIRETLGTLETAIALEVLVTILVVIVMLVQLTSSLLISGLLPLAVLLCFGAMRTFGISANIVSLSGIAIAIGAMVDMGIIIMENINRRMAEAAPGESYLSVIYNAATEVGGAVLTASATTIVGFLPVFTMEGPEGKLFRPLAFTKTFALFAAILVAVLIIPPLARAVFSKRLSTWRRSWMLYEGLIYLGIVTALWVHRGLGAALVVVGAYHLLKPRLPAGIRLWLPWITTIAAGGAVTVLLALVWSPMGPGNGLARNLAFVVLVLGGFLVFFRFFQEYYTQVLSWCLNNKKTFLAVPLVMIAFGLLIWLGFGGLFGWLPNSIKSGRAVSAVAHTFPGLGKEFMPPLDEGAYLYMPETMPHASIGEVLDIVQKQDRRIKAIPEVESAVGKLGRADSPLDPAPVSMIETLISFFPEYLTDGNGRLLMFRFDRGQVDFFRRPDGRPVIAPDGKPYVVPGRFARDPEGRLIPDAGGRPFRQWRPALLSELNPGRKAWAGVQQPDDIWASINEAARMLGVTAAPRLQPISARLVMLQTGISASFGVQVSGPDLESIQQAGLQIEKFLRLIPVIDPETVIAERVIGKPYLEIHVDRRAAAQNGVSVQQVQDTIEYAIGGRPVTTTVEGRERFPVRVRYLRELRDDIQRLGEILVPSPLGIQIPLKQMAEIRFVRGPQEIKSVNSFLASYVLFEKKSGYADLEVIRQARSFLSHQMELGELSLPAGVSFTFVGTFENQVRAEKKLMLILPLSLFIIFIILYLHFKEVSTAALVFSGIAVAWAGGFIMIWCYGQPWFLDFKIFGADMRALFQVHPINLSVAVWVGFLALFGIAADDGVVMATYLKDNFAKNHPATIQGIRKATVEAGQKRVRPCLMTTATTILALLPVLTSTGRGSDIMVPMAVPTFGGMVFALITIFVVPVLYCAIKEQSLLRKQAEIV